MAFWKRMAAAGTFALLFASTVHGHALWVNLYESTTHPPGHVLANIGWGHQVPIDDFLGSGTGRIRLESYSLLDPGMHRLDLPFPETKPPEVLATAKTGLQVETGDLGLIRIPYSETMAEGTYQVVVESRENFFTIYRDKTGKKKMAPKSMDRIGDASEIIASMQFKMTGKAYFSLAETWKPPEPVGHDLELLPMTDLGNLRAGDIVTFGAKLMGEPLNTGASGMYTLTLSSNGFGGPDGFHLGAYVRNGTCSFRVPAAGRWLATLYLRQNVSESPDLKPLATKCKTALYGSTIAFEVAP